MHPLDCLRPALFSMAVMAPLASGNQDSWSPLFDGRTLDGWTAPENPETWSVEEGAIVCHGPRSHLFYTGRIADGRFRNFVFEAEVWTEPGSNSGIYFHTQVQDEGWPAAGYEAQIINSNPVPLRPEEAYVEHKMTGSIYAIRNIWKAPAADGEWFRYRIEVRGDTIRTWINGALTGDYTEPPSPPRPDDKKGRLLGAGTFALQGHDPDSVVRFRNLRVRLLPDDLESPGNALGHDNADALLTHLSDKNYPLIDFTLPLDSVDPDAVCQRARLLGFTPGFVVPVEDVQAAQANLPATVYIGVEIAGNSRRSAIASMGERIDFVRASVREFSDPKNATTQIQSLEEAGVDILTDAFELPREQFDEVVSLLRGRQIALQLPDRIDEELLQRVRAAKEAQIRFTLPSILRQEDLEQVVNRLGVIEQAELTWHDLWLPKYRRLAPEPEISGNSVTAE